MRQRKRFVERGTAAIIRETETAAREPELLTETETKQLADCFVRALSPLVTHEETETETRLEHHPEL